MAQFTTNWNPRLYNDKHAFVYNYGEAVIELLQPKSYERILDLGCGSGQLTSKLHELAQEVIGIDKSPEMIADAKSKFPTIPFKVGDAANFRFSKKFDAIFSNATLHWVTAHHAAIQCMFSNLKPGGRIAVEFGGKGNVQHIVNELKRALMWRGYIRQARLQAWYFPSVGEYASELESVGFRVTAAFHFDRPTELADEATGIKDWLTMFGKYFFQGVSQRDIEAIKQEVQDNLKPTLFKNGKWYADYKRIRVLAVKSDKNN